MNTNTNPTNKNRIFKSKFFIYSIILGIGFLLFAMTPNMYGQVSSVETLRKMVILENGRIKPMDTFAQNMLKQFSGQSKFDGKPAIDWLARVLFTPQESLNDKVFLITNPDVLDSIEIKQEGKARDRYSFAQLQPGIQKLQKLAMEASKRKDQDRSFIENEIMGLYNKLYIYQELLASFDFYFPHPNFTANHPETRQILALSPSPKGYSFFDMAKRRENFKNAMASIKAKSQDTLTPAEQEISGLYTRMFQMVQYYTDHPLTILPPVHTPGASEMEEKWMSPWDIAKQTISVRGDFPQMMDTMNDFVTAYIARDQEKFDKALGSFNNEVTTQAGPKIRPNIINLEIFYNKLDPFYKCEFFYGFAVLFILLSFIALKKWFYRFSFLLLFIGFFFHLFGVIARTIIMNRPPVTNLYDTFIFTGLIVVLLGIILEFFKKKNLGIITGGLAGFIMLLIAGKYAMEGDTMGMLVAVLDSNFWLAFHVMSIILGYAGVLLSGFIGHAYIIQRLAFPEKEDLLKNTFQAVYAIQAFGLIFTFLGTTLGGIWADQSWGRFWGWDPKENGALLILLWSAILFHARLAGWIKETGFALGTIAGIITVALAWFGVNLLGVGLHSYGFTQGVATLLFVFIAIELVFIFVTLSLAKIKNK